MKRILALILVVMTILTFAACSNDDTDEKKDTANNEPTATKPAATEPATTEPAATEPAKPAYADALAVLDAIWSSYGEDDKFPALGGNRDAMVEDKPGAFDLSATADMTSMLLLPEEHISELTSAASLIHMMNGNTFTSAVFQTDGDLDAFGQVLVDAANSTQFICGAPETIVTLKVDNYVIMAFGADDLIQTFKSRALAIDGITLIHEGPIAFGGNDGGFAIPIF